MQEIVLETLESTERLGRRLAAWLPASAVRLVLLSGPLGSGKTTLVRALVSALPGGEQAEVSSPSFTLCNSYPTRPPVLHCDLYRAGGAPDELLEALDSGEALVVVEWGEYLAPQDLPPEYLDIRFRLCNNQHRVRFEAHGEAAVRLTVEMAT